MGAHNLAITTAPNLLKTNNDQVTINLYLYILKLKKINMTEMSSINNIVQVIIEQFPKLFEQTVIKNFVFINFFFKRKKIIKIQ